MEKRKRKTALECYVDHLTDTPEKMKKMHEFHVNIRNFYKKKWNHPLRPPYVQGMEVDLYKLYDTVMALGGWQKVSQQERWPDVAEMLGVEEDCLNGDHAVKVLYMRYLSKFEQSETVGDIDEMMDSEFARAGRGRQISFFATSECPISMPMRKEYYERTVNGQVETDYSRLAKSLISGLPNEVDFSMNICSLLSHPGPRLLRVSQAPHIITLLVAHTGIFDDFDQSLEDLEKGVWEKVVSRDFARFWAYSGLSKEELELLVPSAVSKKVHDDFDLLTGINHEYSLKDPVSWRIQQVATILRNLSFESINRVAMAHHWPLFKFLFACASCKWPALYTTALDTLSNLACDIDLTWNKLLYCSNQHLLLIIEKGILSEDKFNVIRGIELLGGLSTTEGNEALLCDYLSVNLLERIFSVMTVKDIMLCVYSLECLYQISEMGPGACDKMCQLPNAIQMLITMATIEAVSFGKDGLVGMKVVEYHNPLQAAAHPQQGGPHPGQPGGQPMNGGAGYPQTPQRFIAQQGGTPHPQLSQMRVGVPQMQQQPQPPHTPHQVHHQQQQHHMQTPQQIFPPRPIPVHIPTGNFGCDANIERLTFNWIRQNCSFQPGAWTARGELYAAYVDDLRNFHHSLSGSLNAFSTIMVSIFPDVQFKMADSAHAPLMAALGIRLIKPHKLVTQHSTPQNPQQPQTAAPLQPTLVSSHPLMQQMLAKSNGVVNGCPVPAGVPLAVVRRPSVAPTPSSESSSRSNTPDEGAKPQTTNQLQVCEEPMEARELLIERDSKHEARIVRVENTCRTTTTTATVPETQSAEPTGARVSRSKSGSMPPGREEQKKEENGVEESGDEEEESVDGKPASSVRSASTSRDVPEAKVLTPKARAPSQTPRVPQEDPGEYMCEWDGCGKLFHKAGQILHHAALEHLPEGLSLCKWPGCDATQRTKWSLVTHLQDHHATEPLLKLAAQKRRDGLMPKVPGRYRTDIHREVPPHPGYSRNAAIEAIRRHAFNFLPRDITDDPEGPVTRSIRLTSSLILRNLARYSPEGRHQLRRHERLLCWLALSRLEAGTALAQLLSELQHQAGEAVPAT